MRRKAREPLYLLLYRFEVMLDMGQGIVKVYASPPLLMFLTFEGRRLNPFITLIFF
jgi:hypothetical protein